MTCKPSVLEIVILVATAAALVLLPFVCFARDEFFYVESTGPGASREPDGDPPAVVARPGLRLEINAEQPVSNADELPGALDVTLHTTTGCPPCETMKAALKADTRLNVTLAPINSIPPGVPLSAFPFITFRDAAGKLRYNATVRTANDVARTVAHYQGKHSPTYTADQLRAASANTAAGAIHGREVIRQALDWWREHIGQGTATVTWTRNGAQKLPLMRAVEWTPLAIYGTSGALSCAVTGAAIHTLPVTDALIDYRLLGDQIRLRGETSIDASLLGIDTDGTPKAVGDAKPVGFLDPISLLSAASLIWGLLNPQADLTLPGQISASATMRGESLVVTFTDAPSVRIVMLFTFTLRVESVSITTERVVLKFSGSRFIQQKTFEVKPCATNKTPTTFPACLSWSARCCLRSRSCSSRLVPNCCAMSA